jgi:hypothetical protein
MRMNDITVQPITEIVGEWVPRDRVGEMTNVYGRRWMTPDMTQHGVYYPGMIVPLDVLWYFPSADEQARIDAEREAWFAEHSPAPSPPWWRRVLRWAL